MLVGFSSCSSDSEELMTEETLTEADLFVASKEFQNYQNYLMDDAKMMKKVLKGLSKQKKERYHNLLDSLPNYRTIKHRDQILNEIGNLLGINYKLRLYRIEANSNKLREKINFTNAELLSAMQRRNANALNSPVVVNSLEERYEKCISNCDHIYEYSILGCPSDIWSPCPDLNEDFINNDCEDYWECRSKVEKELSSCYDECSIYY